MLGFELFDLLCNLVQESGQGVRFVVANLTDQGVEAVHKTMVVSKSLRDGQSQLVENIASFSWAHHSTVCQNVADINLVHLAEKLTHVIFAYRGEAQKQ
jgi:hypothetical protein